MKFGSKERGFGKSELTFLRLRIIAKSAILGKSIEKLPENRYDRKTNSGMNLKVSDIIQYYAYKIIDVLD